MMTVGIWASAASWDLERAVRSLRIDYLVADCQHGSWTQEQLERLFCALGARSGSPCRPLVRTGLAPAAAEIGRYLDAGAWGLIVPFVETAECIRAVRAAMHYPPSGSRSAARNIGLRNTGLDDLDAYIDWTRRHLSLIAMVETRRGLERAEEILAHSDGLLVGLKDLALDLELDIDACVERVARCPPALRDAKPFGFLGLPPRRQREEGGTMINLGNVRDLIGEAIEASLAELGFETSSPHANRGEGK